MSTRTPKRPTVRQIPHTGPAKPRWRVIAVSSPDPVAFAAALEQNLNELMEEGWNLSGMMERGDATVLTAQRLELPSDLAAHAAQPTQPDLSDVSAPGEREEFIYHYLELTEHKQRTFPSLAAAAAAVAKDMEGNDVLPISVSAMRVTTYDAMGLIAQRPKNQQV